MQSREKLTGALFIDLRKAFDSVPHKELLSKLRRFGFGENSINWFTSYLSDRFQAVSLDNELSSPLAVLSGVPQRSILGPVLFALYINDLPSCVDVCKVMMYADDTVIFFSAPLISEIELQLNLELINLSEWLSTNKLILNLKKTEFMVFGTHQRLCRQDIDGAHITLGGESVKHCDAFKYLGVVLDNSLSFNLHIDYVKKKVSKTLGMFSRIRSSLTTEASNRLYKSMILPNLEYCCAVFHGCGKGNEEELERLQRRAARIVLKTVNCPLKIWLLVLVATLLRREEKNISSNLSRIVLKDKLQVISQIIFDGELMIFMTLTLGLRIGYLLIKSISSLLRGRFL